MAFGITLGSSKMSAAATPQRSSPVSRWRVLWTGGADQIEVWPVPDVNGMYLRLNGKLKLTRMVNDSDVSLLNGTLIVMFAAAEKRAGQKDGAKRDQDAQRFLMSLKAHDSKAQSFRLGETSRPRTRPGTIVRISGGA